MIAKYTRPEMGALWSEENKFNTWLRVEILAAKAQAELGFIPTEAYKNIESKAGFDIQRIQDIEEEIQHDFLAFLTSVKEHVGDSAKYIHLGMTSSDVIDTALSVTLRDSLRLLVEGSYDLYALLHWLSLEHQNTIMVGRTHGVHAEPITLGLKFALWSEEVSRNITRLVNAEAGINFGKLSGAVGTYANIDPRVETIVCKELGLTPAPVSSQILQRDRHAEVVTAMAIYASSLEKFATEIRHLQKTEVLELEEPFGKNQKGSSAMPHKRNPVVCERICGLARLVRGYSLSAMENIPLWHERDISHSSVERIVLPDSCILLDYMISQFKWILEGLQVHQDNIATNLTKSHGLIFSQKVLLALVGKGLSREDAYLLVQRNAMQSWAEHKDFRTLLETDVEVHLTSQELDEIFDLSSFLKNLKQRTY